MRRFLPGVPVTVVESGNGQGQVPLHELPGTLKGMKKALTAQEVQAVDKRLTALNTNRLPISTRLSRVFLIFSSILDSKTCLWPANVHTNS